MTIYSTRPVLRGRSENQSIRISRRDPGRNWVIGIVRAEDRQLAVDAKQEAKKKAEARRNSFYTDDGRPWNWRPNPSIGKKPHFPTAERALWAAEERRNQNRDHTGWDRWAIAHVMSNLHVNEFTVTEDGREIQMALQSIDGLAPVVFAHPKEVSVILHGYDVKVPATTWVPWQGDNTPNTFVGGTAPRLRCPTTFYACTVTFRPDADTRRFVLGTHLFHVVVPGSLFDRRFDRRLRQLVELLRAEGATWQDRIASTPLPSLNRTTGEPSDHTTKP